MDASTLEETLVRLSLDGEGSRLVAGMRGFPLLKLDGRTLFACSKTVLVKTPNGKHVPAPGIRYVIANERDEPASDFDGRRHFVGPVDATLDLFMDRFGEYFSKSEIEIENPTDPFSRYFATA